MARCRKSRKLISDSLLAKLFLANFYLGKAFFEKGFAFFLSFLNIFLSKIQINRDKSHNMVIYILEITKIRYNNILILGGIMENKKISIVKDILLIIIGLCLLVFFIYPQVIGNVVERQNRNSGFVKMTNGNQEIYLLGTWHGIHWTSKEFSLQHLGSVVENLEPDVLLLESRQEQLDLDNLADGPLEMLFSNLTAREISVPVKGIDWWNIDLSNPGQTDELRESNIMKNIIEYSKGEKKVLILIGNAHVSSLQTRFKEAGFSRAEFKNKEKNLMFHSDKESKLFPSGMSFYIEKRIEYEREMVMTGGYKREVIIAAAKNVIVILQEMLETVKTIGENDEIKLTQ